MTTYNPRLLERIHLANMGIYHVDPMRISTALMLNCLVIGFFLTDQQLGIAQADQIREDTHIHPLPD
jgi:hypothetical protein